MSTLKKTFVLGDLHGGHKALLQCFERAHFDYENDQLISLGDLCDGWPETRQCIDELLKVKNLILIKGNHDQWFYEWIKTGAMPNIWTSQGGLETLNSYERNRENVPDSHTKLLESAKLFLVDDKNRAFVHGGFFPLCPLDTQGEDIILWDRDLIMCAQRKDQATKRGKREDKPLTRYAEVFLGHTTTTYFHSLEPVHYCEIFDVDTGGGWEGKLTLMNVDTHEYVQSDLVPDLYPACAGRRG